MLTEKDDLVDLAEQTLVGFLVEVSADLILVISWAIFSEEDLADEQVIVHAKATTSNKTFPYHLKKHI
jgi:hypothetical protein